MNLRRESAYGAIRGYALARRAKEIKLKDIFVEIEGPDLFHRCILWRDRCADDNPCPMHHRWKRIRQQVVEELMERTTLADLLKQRLRAARSPCAARKFASQRLESFWRNKR